MAASLIGTGAAQIPPTARRSPDPLPTPPVAGLHLQFGADASSEMVVSWHTLQSVRNPRVVLGASRWSAGARGRGQRGQLHRCKSRPGCLRLSCEDQSTAARFFVLVWSFPRRRRAGIRHVPDLPAGSRAVHLHQLRRSRHADLGQEVRAARGCDDPKSPLCERQSRLAGGRATPRSAWSSCSHCSTFSTAISVTPISPTIGCGTGWGFLGEQQPQRPQTSLDALSRQSRERARQWTDRVSGIPDLLLGAGIEPARRM